MYFWKWVFCLVIFGVAIIILLTMEYYDQASKYIPEDPDYWKHR